MLTEGIEEEADPGKPSFRVGYVELGVEDATKRLKVDVKANKDEYRPASKARVEVQVKDAGHDIHNSHGPWLIETVLDWQKTQGLI